MIVAVSSILSARRKYAYGVTLFLVVWFGLSFGRSAVAAQPSSNGVDPTDAVGSAFITGRGFAPKTERLARLDRWSLEWSRKYGFTRTVCSLNRWAEGAWKFGELERTSCRFVYEGMRIRLTTTPIGPSFQFDFPLKPKEQLGNYQFYIPGRLEISTCRELENGKFDWLAPEDRWKCFRVYGKEDFSGDVIFPVKYLTHKSSYWGHLKDRSTFYGYRPKGMEKDDELFIDQHIAGSEIHFGRALLINKLEVAVNRKKIDFAKVSYALNEMMEAFPIVAVETAKAGQ